jgi:hypothetical protein
MSGGHGRLASTAWLAVAAGILVHNVALSSYELLQGALERREFTELGELTVPVMILVIGSGLGVGLFFLGRRLKDWIHDLLEAGGYGVSQRLLDTVVVTESPGGLHKAAVVVLGVVVILFLCALHWVAHEIWHIVAHLWHVPWFLLMGGSAVLALVIAWRLRSVEHEDFQFRMGTPGPVDALILFLSGPLGRPLPGRKSGYKSVDEFRLEFESLMKRIELPLTKEKTREIFGENSWAMPICSISEVARSVKHVVVVGSNDSPNNPGTRGLAAWFGRVVGASLPAEGRPEFHAWPPPPSSLPSRADGETEKEGPSMPGVDFENFDELKEAMEGVLAMLAEKGARRISVDVTGGTKICTIVGLLKMLEPGRNAMYVSTSKLEVYSTVVRSFSHRLGELPHEDV